MTLLKMKAAGLGLVLVGGLTMAHGAAVGQTWETAIGLLIAGLGVVLLAAKVIRRTTPTTREF